MSIAADVGLEADAATVLHDSNRIAVRLLPCGVLASVAPGEHRAAAFEVELTRQLARVGSPVVGLDPRVADAQPFERDGFTVTLWTYYEQTTRPPIPPSDYAEAMEQLHGGMRTLDVALPQFTERVEEAQELVASRARTPLLSDPDRDLLARALRERRRAIDELAGVEQPLHGEPHPGNLLSTDSGPLFIDLETCCRGPVEFDLAHVPVDVCAHYPGLDLQLLGECRGVVLAMIAAWRWDAEDQFPDGQRAGNELLSVVRAGPPWPTLDAVWPRAGIP
jgi:hypothetical protein